MLPPLKPITPINILDKDGYPVRNDNVTNFAYVGNGTGLTPPEMYIAFHPGQQSNDDPIKPGQTAIFENMQTGMWCRLANFTPQTTCRTQGMLCDQASPDSADHITYTGFGLAYQGVPLVREKGSGTLVLSDDPACSEPGGEKFKFPPGAAMACRGRATSLGWRLHI